ncbi:H-NS family nucleoid-associated regulatory protein [Sinimarinibacterium sp. NLF-5-8]|uniref:H-NS histone family protein n=1 Tax=Sinimarinibacterium sp. NLF-5-8 TaxID=2698684 RepID=UPI00137C083C|nr:H-NS histone family protein [Sinimarinibacterium sp. NLF-5-8]QHS09370.1 H-NS histone family protein [Sinimarinibacterium sp. NLF-5-8]
MATFLEIQQQIAALQAQADELRRAEVAAVIAEIHQKMDIYGLTAADLSRGSAAARGGSKGRKAVEPKYENRATGQTWTGRGKPPRWLADAEAAGRSRDEFLIRR